MTLTSPGPYADIFMMVAEDGLNWHRYISDKLKAAPAAGTISQSWMVLHKSLELEDVSLACSESSLVVLLATCEVLDLLVDNNYGLNMHLQEVPDTGKVVVLPLLDVEGRADLYAVVNDSRYGYHPPAWTFLDMGGGSVDEVDQVIATMLNMVEECLLVKKMKEREERDRAEVEGQEKEEEGQEKEEEGQEKEEEGQEEEVEEEKGGELLKVQEEEEEGEKEMTTGDESTHPQKQRRRSLPPVAKPRRNHSRAAADYVVLAEFFPATVYECGVDVAMVLREKVHGKVTLKLDQDDLDEIATQRRSSELFTFTMPHVAPGTYTVQVLVDGTPLPATNQRPAQLTVYGGPELTSFTSLHYLMQAHGLTTPQELDLKLTEVFNSSLPADGTLKVIFDDKLSASSEYTNFHNVQYPTILHYAAAHGLSEFCAALLECPGSTNAFNIPNCDGLHPDQLAERGGFHELHKYISDFMDMQTANEIYGRYISMTMLLEEDEEEEEDDDDDSDSGSDYEAVPTALIPSSSGIHKPSGQFPKREKVEHADMELGESPAARQDRPPIPPPRVPTHGSSAPRRRHSERSSSSSSHHEQDTLKEGSDSKSKTLPPGSKLDASAFIDMTGNVPVDLQQPLPRAAVGSSSQSELIELNEMVKRKEINLNEAEMLYNAWRVRYGKNSNASFKERQREITEIKHKYNEIRQEHEKHHTKSFLSRFGFHGHHNKSTVKVKITDPILQRQAKKTGPRVFVKPRTPSGQLAQASVCERISTASTTSSSTSSRDSGWSQCSHDSTTSSLDPERDGEGAVDAVFVQEGSPVRRRKTSSTSSVNRLSLGHQYLEDAKHSEGRDTCPAPPPLPPRKNQPPLQK